MRKRGKQQRTSEYSCTDRVIPDSNICERAFNRAIIFIHNLRAHMAPESLQRLLFLCWIKIFWDCAAIIDEAISWEAAATAAATLLLLLSLLQLLQLPPSRKFVTVMTMKTHSDIGTIALIIAIVCMYAFSQKKNVSVIFT